MEEEKEEPNSSGNLEDQEAEDEEEEEEKRLNGEISEGNQELETGGAGEPDPRNQVGNVCHL